MAIPTFDAPRHAEMLGLLGPELTAGAMLDLRAEIGRAFTSPPGADLSHDAHAVSSQAEILGFLALGAACRDLERGIKLGGDIDASLERARACAAEATEVIEAMASR